MRKLSDCGNWIFTNIIIPIPLVILFILGGWDVYLLITAPMSVERMHFLLSIDAAAATLAGLSFYASYASRDERRRDVYFRCAENFFHGSILLFVATLLHGCISTLHGFGWHSSWKILLQAVTVSATTFFFLYGLFEFIRGLRDLLSFIHNLRRQ